MFSHLAQHIKLTFYNDKKTYQQFKYYYKGRSILQLIVSAITRINLIFIAIKKQPFSDQFIPA
jgi:hypothetical protein